MRAFVTGGAGFIGSHLVDALLARGDNVTVIDDLSTGKRIYEATAFQRVDVREPIVFEKADVVFHLAAQTDVQTSMRDPVFDADVNIVGTARVAEAAHAAGAKLIFTSTGGAIYGECLTPAIEDSALRPSSPYGISKLCGERYVARHGGITLRLGNVYGPRQSAKAEGGVVAIFLDALRHGKKPTIYGDGLQTRDFVYVGDVIEALLAAGNHAGPGTMNIGTGVATTIGDVYTACCLALGMDALPSWEDARDGDLRRSVISPERAEWVLGWRPSTSLADGIAVTADSF